ncbi:YqhG family protein [Gracilibacillus phocaeensis]|uniref:YqhG family protein n=1 Tax=Gracilibacillus phocaeensis TaxID=2042304 RepID=UPI001030AF0A|nr:YqhG family protein [Gracilibacillus phocaeensis]
MITNLHGFLDQFFTQQHCHVTKEQETGLTVRLTRELDQALMNRPFYWHYMDKMGRQGEPMSLSLDTGWQSEDRKKEWLHFGSPRLQQIFRYITQEAQYTLLYEQTTNQDRSALLPWLVVNVKVQYHGKQTKEAIHSIGLQLINGTLSIQMMDKLQTIAWGQRMEDYCYTISPLITPRSGFQRTFHYIEQHLLDQDTTWIKESIACLEEELQLLHYFFSEDEHLLATEEEQLRQRLQPDIHLIVHNAGLFYVTEKTNQTFLQPN